MQIIVQEKMSLLPPINQQHKYPSTRFMGSKSKLIDAIWNVSKEFDFNTVLDLFSGSGVVGYMYKCHDKEVTSNDYMAMAATFSKALIENSKTILLPDEVNHILCETETDGFVETVFKGLYFSDEENHLIDVIRTNIDKIEDSYKEAIATASLIRACMKKRPRGIFTYTGKRYIDGRQDLQKSFEQQFREAVDAINNAVFDNGKQNKSSWADSMNLIETNYDLVYMDPPYYTPQSDNEYVRRYHFVEGLARNWEGVTIQEETKTKKFKSYPTPFSTREGAITAFQSLFHKYSNSILIISYSSNSQPTKEEMIDLLSSVKKNVRVIPLDYTYSFGTRKTVKRNNVQEYLFVGW